MPSTVVHVALAGLLAAGLLPDDYFDRRAVLVVLGIAVIPDLDVFFGSVIDGAHRSLGHNLLLPALAATVLGLDLRRGEHSVVRSRYGPGGGPVFAVGIVGFVVAGIGLDYVVNGANLFWPLHDQFFTANGKAILSNQRGFVQTFVDLTPEPPSDGGGGGGKSGRTSEPKTTDNTHYSTGVDPTEGKEKKNVERVFPLVRSG
ncbi:MAG: metal-dependent hydrolase, partial [Halobaculum sp.]